MIIRYALATCATLLVGSTLDCGLTRQRHECVSSVYELEPNVATTEKFMGMLFYNNLNP